MLVLTKQAEEKLYQEIQIWGVEDPTHRCLVIRFSQVEENKDIWFQPFSNALQATFDETHQIKVFLCHDGDVFVTGRMITQKHVETFLSHLAPKLSSASHPRLTSLFEIGVQQKRLKNMCQSKITQREMAKEKKNENQKDTLDAISREQTLAQIDRDLVSSLPMRRSMREGIKVMIVEDDPFSENLVVSALRNSYDVLSSRDGQSAIMNYSKNAPDVLFLDIGLPDMSGHAVLEKIFKLDQDAYVVMLSGNGDKDNVMRAVQLGAKGFVGKPFSKDKLINYIEKSPHIQAKRKTGAARPA